MIAFDSSKLSVEIVELKSITSALGGSITIVDKTKSKGICRVDVPMAACRAFIKKHKISKYLIPVITAIVRYGNHVISMERHPLGSLGVKEQVGLDGSVQVWKSDSQLSIDNYIIPMTKQGKWYFDGRYVYTFNNEISDVIKTATKLSQDGLFRSVEVNSIDLQDMTSRSKMELTSRCCLAFVTKSGLYSISPPVWKNAESIGNSQLAAMQDNIDIENISINNNNFNFDQIDDNMSVNLNFALRAGNEISKIYGFESIEPLRLADLMIDLHTVNLPNIPKQVKATYDIGIKFTHTLSWLLGLSRRANTLESYIVIRGLMKYLTQKGIFKNNTLKASHIFINGKTTNDIKVIDLATKLQEAA